MIIVLCCLGLFIRLCYLLFVLFLAISEDAAPEKGVIVRTHAHSLFSSSPVRSVFLISQFRLIFPCSLAQRRILHAHYSLVPGSKFSDANSHVLASGHSEPNKNPVHLAARALP
jgi:hypothetical protein